MFLFPEPHFQVNNLYIRVKLHYNNQENDVNRISLDTETVYAIRLGQITKMDSMVLCYFGIIDHRYK